MPIIQKSALLNKYENAWSETNMSYATSQLLIGSPRCRLTNLTIDVETPGILKDNLRDSCFNRCVRCCSVSLSKISIPAIRNGIVGIHGSLCCNEVSRELNSDITVVQWTVQSDDSLKREIVSLWHPTRKRALTTGLHAITVSSGCDMVCRKCIWDCCLLSTSIM